MQQRLILVLAATAIAVVWQLPFGRQLLYPLTLLSTFAHELGHGLTALLMGAHFDHLQLNTDGSGSAVWHGNQGLWRLRPLRRAVSLVPAWRASHS